MTPFNYCQHLGFISTNDMIFNENSDEDIPIQADMRGDVSLSLISDLLVCLSSKNCANEAQHL